MLTKLSTLLAARSGLAHAAGALLGAVVICAAYKGFYAPLKQDIDDRTLRIERVRLLQTGGERIARDHRQMEQRFAELTLAAEQTRRRMPTEANAGDFVEQATQLAADLDLEVEQCQTASPQFHDDHATIDVTCRLSGSFASVCQYLAAVDQLPQISRVLFLDMSKSPESEGYPVQVIFQLYYQIDPHDKDPQQGPL